MADASAFGVILGPNEPAMTFVDFNVPGKYFFWDTWRVFLGNRSIPRIFNYYETRVIYFL